MKNLRITDVRCQKGDSSFLIDAGKTSILYDSGFGFTGFEVANNIKESLGKRNLDYIFLTHSHYDHALGSACILRHFPDAKVVASRYAAEIFQRDGAKRVMKELDSKFAEKCGVTHYEFFGDELHVDIPVEDGDIISAGDMKFQVIALPGHTRCSIGFYCEEKKFFLSNETLGVYDGDNTILPSYLVSYSDSIKSIKKIEGLDIKHLLSPHLGILSSKQTEFFLNNMKSAAEETARCFVTNMRNGKSADEITKSVKDKYWHGYIKDIYPEDAINLNTKIMIELIKKELVYQEESK